MRAATYKDEDGRLNAAAANTGRNPFVFAVGCPRSGTTLLRRILNAHPQLAIPKVETHWIPKFFNKGLGLTRDGRATPGLLDHLAADHRFQRMGISLSELDALLAAGPGQSYPEFTGRLFDLYGEKQGKALAGDKTPGYVRHVTLLHSLFPRAKFIHLIRDGRDVCLSILAWDRRHKSVGRLQTFAEDPVGTTALFWDWLVRLGREAGARLPAGWYFEVKYESLVADPGKAARDMCAFLDLPFERAMLDYHAGKTRDDAGLSAKKAWLPPTSGLRDWRTQMSAADQLRFEAAAGGLIAELGYERSCEHISGKALRHADRLREAFERRPRPAAWQTSSPLPGATPA